MRMPVIFIGHGSPMNAIEDNEFSRSWKELGARLPKPKAILSVSAHWYTAGTFASDSAHPKTVYDMYGFPDALYEIVYNAPGAPELARRAMSLLGRPAALDRTWGLDHGTWSVLNRMYPAADVPVFQVSVDRNAPLRAHFEAGRLLKPLRDEGVLIMGSGNVVHNLERVNWGLEGGYPWAELFDGYIRERVLAGDFEKVVDPRGAGASAQLALPTPDHYAPLLWALGAADEADAVTAFNDKCAMGSISMTSYLFEEKMEGA